MIYLDYHIIVEYDKQNQSFLQFSSNKNIYKTEIRFYLRNRLSSSSRTDIDRQCDKKFTRIGEISTEHGRTSTFRVEATRLTPVHNLVAFRREIDGD